LQQGIIILLMRKMIAYMVTWTTYGTWLQGDKRKYVKNGRILPANDKLTAANRKQQKFQTIRLSPKQRQIVEKAIIQEAQRINQKILAMTVCSNHIHIVAKVSEKSIEQAVHGYKYSATSALRDCTVQNRIWSRGFDKKFCFTEKEIKQKIRYVQNHNKNG